MKSPRIKLLTLAFGLCLLAACSSSGDTSDINDTPPAKNQPSSVQNSPSGSGEASFDESKASTNVAASLGLDAVYLNSLKDTTDCKSFGDVRSAIEKFLVNSSTQKASIGTTICEAPNASTIASFNYIHQFINSVEPQIGTLNGELKMVFILVDPKVLQVTHEGSLFTIEAVHYDISGITVDYSNGTMTCSGTAKVEDKTCQISADCSACNF